jgi:hypothetical protein
MSGLNVNTVRSEALFASPLQQSQYRTPAQAREAIRLAIRQFGSRGCAARVAQEFGDRPETAVQRMRWARELVGQIWPYAAVERRAGQRLNARCTCTVMDQLTSFTGRAPLTRTSVSRAA